MTTLYDRLLAELMKPDRFGLSTIANLPSPQESAALARKNASCRSCGIRRRKMTMREIFDPDSAKAEIACLQARVAELQRCAVQGQEMAKEQMDRCITAEKERSECREQAHTLRDRCQKIEELLGKENFERDSLRAKIERATGALAWYGENARLCRLIHSEGDAGRNALSDDGGARARAALAELSADAPAQGGITLPSKGWCEKMSSIEGDHEIGAGLLAADPDMLDAAPAQQSDVNSSVPPYEGVGKPGLHQQRGSGGGKPRDMEPGNYWEPIVGRGGGRISNIAHEPDGTGTVFVFGPPGGGPDAPAQQTQADRTRARLEDERNELQNSFGQGAFLDGKVRDRIAEIDAELSAQQTHISDEVRNG